MLSENKFSKYFLYAIGEIVLVVIGILIALQINNSNMNKIQRATELKLLEELYTDYESNRTEITNILSDVIDHQNQIDTIFVYLDNNKPLDESLLNSFHQIQYLPVFNSANAAYKSIENNGISILSEPIIRKDATMLYDEYFRNINERRNSHFRLINNNLMPLIRRNFQASMRYNKIADVNFMTLNVPIDLDSLRIDNEFRNTLYEIQRYLVSRKYLLGKTLSLLNEKMVVLESHILKMKK